MKKLAIVTGVILLLVSSNVLAQGAPPPPPAPSGDPAAAPPPEAAPPGTGPGPAAYPPGYGRPGYAQPVPVRIVEPPEPAWRYRLSLNLSLPTLIQFDIGLSKRIGLLFAVGGFSILDFYWVDTVVGLNVFLRGRAPKGFWIGAKLSNGWMGIKGESDNLYIGSVKVLFGYNWIWRSGFSFGLGLGAQYLYVAAGQADDFFLEGFFVTWDITLGWGF